MSTKSKLRFLGAFAALATLALAMSCRGFFPADTFTSLAIEPSSPQVPLQGTQSLQLWGTDTSGNHSQITSGASWSIQTGTTGSATITNAGVATGTTVGAITVNVSYQGITASTSGVVYLANISSICVSLTNTSGNCSAGTESISSSNPAPVSLYAIADYTNGSGQTVTQDITTSATWTVSGPSSSGVTCATSTSPAVCTYQSGGNQGNYVITVSYPQTSITGTNTIQVGQ